MSLLNMKMQGRGLNMKNQTVKELFEEYNDIYNSILDHSEYMELPTQTEVDYYEGLVNLYARVLRINGYDSRNQKYQEYN